jgi:hypothetical protein
MQATITHLTQHGLKCIPRMAWCEGVQVVSCMIQIIAAVLLFAPAPDAVAVMESSPTELYSLKKRMTDKVMIDVVVVKNVRAACEKESHERGLGGFGYGMSACSFWTNLLNHYTCTVIVPENTNNDTLGHEFRHCIQGHFH